MGYFFTADEHYGHRNIIQHAKRPFGSTEDMDEALIECSNRMVGPRDIVIHVGDFTLAPTHVALEYLRRLNGIHWFIRGSHDKWLDGSGIDAPYMMEKKIEGVNLTICHYAMRHWHKSHYGSWQVHGHSHGGMPPIGKQWDVGVDNNDFHPVSMQRLREIMEGRPEIAHHGRTGKGMSVDPNSPEGMAKIREIAAERSS